MLFKASKFFNPYTFYASASRDETQNLNQILTVFSANEVNPAEPG
jgi:hypothetical protein